MKYCTICNGQLNPLITYENQPSAAQHFPVDQILPHQPGIDLKIYECASCGTVQIPEKPVAYYTKAIRSPLWDTDPFRKQQYEALVQEFRLQGKRIKNITEGPVPEKYDAFLMFNYLEHFPNPRETLTQIYNNLEGPSVGIVEVPNFDEIIRDRIFGEFVIDHLYYFTEKTLRFVCEASGFDVLSIREIWGGASLSAIVRKRIPLNKVPFLDNQRELIQSIDDFVVRMGSATIWGAGHQTLMMLTMLKSLDRIPYIVDSFVDKQNKFTPVTYKPVVKPEHMHSEPVKGIIIIVGWQFCTVTRQIEDMSLDPIPAIALIQKAKLELYNISSGCPNDRCVMPEAVRCRRYRDKK